jgi:hypothetical protein
MYYPMLSLQGASCRQHGSPFGFTLVLVPVPVLLVLAAMHTTTTGYAMTLVAGSW